MSSRAVGPFQVFGGTRHVCCKSGSLFLRDFDFQMSIYLFRLIASTVSGEQIVESDNVNNVTGLSSVTSEDSATGAQHVRIL